MLIVKAVEQTGEFEQVVRQSVRFPFFRAVQNYLRVLGEMSYQLQRFWIVDVVGDLFIYLGPINALVLHLAKNAAAACVRILNVEDRVFIGLRDRQLEVKIEVTRIGAHQEKVSCHIDSKSIVDGFGEFINE